MAQSTDYKALKKQKTYTYTALQTIGIIALLLIGNCFDWLNMKFDFSVLGTWSYWNGVIQQVLMYSLALIIGYLGRLEKEIINNEEYELNMNLYHQYLAQKTASFTAFCEKHLNPRIKVEYFKMHIEKKLYKLDKKYRKKDAWKVEYDRALDWFNSSEGERFCDYQVSDYIGAGKNEFLARLEKRKCKGYILCRFNLDTLLEEQHLKDNAKSFSDYPRVNPHAFTWGLRMHETNANQYKVENQTGKDLASRFMQKALSVVLTAILIGSITADASGNELLEQANGWAKLLIKYAIRVCSIVWSYGNGIYFGKGIFESNYLDVVNNRNNILAEYIDWKSTVKETETESYKIRIASLKENTISATKSEEKKDEVKLTEEEIKDALMREKAKKQANQLVHDSISN